MAKEKSLMLIDAKKIKFNPANIRGEKPEQIEADRDFIVLKESVHQYGILVPLIVRKIDGGKYLLLDGERRLRAALANNMDKVPARVVTERRGELPDTIRSFQIHMLRKQWSNVAQAMALRRIIDAVRKDQPHIGDRALDRTLQENTGYKVKELQDLKSVLHFGPGVLSEVEEGSISWSHLVQIEQSFVEVVKRRFPGLLQEFGEQKIRELLLEKVRNGVIRYTRTLMNELSPVFIRAQKKEQQTYLRSLLKLFLKKHTWTVQEVVRRFDLKFPVQNGNYLQFISDAKQKAQGLYAILKILNNFPRRQVAIYPKPSRELASQLKSLRALINKILKKLRSV